MGHWGAAEAATLAELAAVDWDATDDDEEPYLPGRPVSSGDVNGTSLGCGGAMSYAPWMPLPGQGDDGDDEAGHSEEDAEAVLVLGEELLEATLRAEELGQVVDAAARSEGLAPAAASPDAIVETCKVFPRPRSYDDAAPEPQADGAMDSGAYGYEDYVR